MPELERVGFMREAIRLAREGVQTGGGPFGAIVVKGGSIVGQGSNRVTAALDPTAHAEVVAIRDACQRLGSFRLEGCELFASCEPCPMCLGAVYWARLERVYYAALRTDATDAGFDDGFIYREIPLPPERRQLGMTCMLREEALPAFAQWRAKPDKVPY
jgi:tRNA(Arg) A34 adenosine deaminase TadA